MGYMAGQTLALFEHGVNIGTDLHFRCHLSMTDITELSLLTFNERFKHKLPVAKMTGLTVMLFHRGMHKLPVKFFLFFLVTLHAGLGGKPPLYLYPTWSA
jgi:hypothetical protein